MESKLDCSLAVNYITEFNRMCNTTYEPMNGCENCPIDKASNSSDCGNWIVNNQQKAVEIVQAWSDEHPKEKVATLQDKFLEQYPNAHLSYPDEILIVNPCSMEQEMTCPGNCAKCRKNYWSQPYKENTNGQD